MTLATNEPVPSLAAVLYEPGTAVDDLLRHVVARLRRHRLKVGGIIQRGGMRTASGSRLMMVEDLLTGTLLQISQNLGPGAQGCILDPHALGVAAGFLRLAMAEKVDVVVVNRFAEQEAHGGGLRTDLAEAASNGFVVVTAVTARHVDAWMAFGGEYAQVLAPKPGRVVAWVRGAAPATFGHVQAVRRQLQTPPERASPYRDALRATPIP